jgi:prevent-host-death family protein
MSTVISLRQANQSFARRVRQVESGAEFIITRNGQPVARLVPFRTERVLSADQQVALARTRARMAAGWPIGAERIDRDALHER